MPGESADPGPGRPGADQIRGALGSAGWTVTWLTGNGLTVEGRAYDVTRVLASRGDLRARVTVARHCEAGGVADRILSAGLPPTTAVRRDGDTKVLADVRDYARARAELEFLLPALRQDDFHQACTDAAAGRGWDMTGNARSASEDWDFSWTIRGTRAGQALDIGLGVRWYHHDEPVSESSGSAVAVGGRLSISVTVYATTEADTLVDTLLAMLKRTGSSGGFDSKQAP
jgi:hypothetical protein